MIRLRLRVSGRVQGVGFRYFTKRAAREHGVCGWVCNESDGSVSCEAQGEVSALEAFLAAVRRGPQFSRVDDVLSREVDSEVPEPSDFEIR